MGFDISKIAIRRGNLFGAVVDGVVLVNHGSAKGYPDGDSILWKLNEADIDSMVALLTAIKSHRPNKGRTLG